MVLILDLGLVEDLGIMEKKMETTIMGYIGIIGYILGLRRRRNNRGLGFMVFTVSGFRVQSLGFGLWGLVLSV